LLQLPRHTRLVGLDVGDKKIGVALSDPGRRIASAAGVVRRGKRFFETAARLEEFWKGEAVSGIVVGLPLNQDGSQGPRAQASRQFAHNIAKHFNLPVALWDERFSSVAAERLLLDEADLSRSRRRELVDQTAAAFILQGCLDFMIGAAMPQPDADQTADEPVDEAGDEAADEAGEPGGDDS
jgi:putative Holliday junction resolvase